LSSEATWYKSIDMKLPGNFFHAFCIL